MSPPSDTQQLHGTRTPSHLAGGAIDTKSWASTISEAARTPPGFFCLALLVVLGGLTAAAVNLAGASQTILVIGMVLALFANIGIVFYLAIKHRNVWPEGGNAPAADQCPADVERIARPSIVCVSTPEYVDKGFTDRGFAIVEKWMGKGLRFHKTVTIRKEANLNDWRLFMLSNKCDILHIAAQVNPKDASIDFGNKQQLDAHAFQELVIDAKIRLVVLATCDAISLGAAVSRATNMIASTAALEPEIFLHWVDVFYMKLAHGAPLSRAYQVATGTITGTHMVLLLNKDVAFK
jgi:hypothetical protein